jgi:hypothetical protein
MGGMLKSVEYSRDSSALFAHVGDCWREAAAGRAMPRRQDISPSRLGKALPYVSLLDVVQGSPIDFQYRLIGQHMVVNTGHNLTGKRCLELPQSAPSGRPIYACFLRCAETGAPGRLDLDILNMNGTKRRMEMAVWPLGDDGQSPSGLLGAALFAE